MGRLTLNMPSIKQPVVLQRATSRGLVLCKDGVRTKEFYCGVEVEMGSDVFVQWCDETQSTVYDGRAMVVRWSYDGHMSVSV